MERVFYVDLKNGKTDLVASFKEENLLNLCTPLLEEQALLEDKVFVKTNCKTETTYYLLGSDAVRSYEEGGVKQVLKDNTYKEFGLFRFEEGLTKSQSFAEEILGWGNYRTIGKEDFIKLLTKV